MMWPTRRGTHTVSTAMPTSISAALTYARQWRRAKPRDELQQRHGD